MDARNNIATDLFYKIRSRFSGLKLGAETGEITINPEEARFFDFDYMEGEHPIGHVSVSLAEPNSMKVYFSHGITESMNDGQKNNWYGFLKELRQFAKRRLLSFDTRDIAKDNLDKRDYQFLAQNAQPKQTQPNTIQQPVGESMMAESNMYGSKTMSYQKLMDTRLIIKHNQAVMDDAVPGARTRHIGALFVENQDGERFKYPFIHLAGARAMQRHVANGGVPYDDIGKSIIGMSEEIAQLKSFGNYVVRNDLMNSDTNSVVERSSAYLNSLREQIKALAKQSHYEAYRENFQAHDSEEIPQDVVEDFTEKFTVKSFKEDIASVFPVLYRLMKEGNTIGYDDIVAMTQEEIQTEESKPTAADPFNNFESWVMGLGEDSGITSQDPEQQQSALQNLQELVSEEFPAGIDGTNAIESLKGIIEDPQLYRDIKEQAKQDPNADIRSLVYNWMGENAPQAAQQLDFGDFQSQNIEDPMAYANAAADADAIAYGQQEGQVTEASSDYQYEYEGADVHFERAPDGTVKVTKITIEDLDITQIFSETELEEFAEMVEPDYDSPMQDVLVILDMDMDFDTYGEERGSREYGTGLQMEPDYPAYAEINSVTLYGNGPKPLTVYLEDLPGSVQEYLQDAADEIAQESIGESEEGEERSEKRAGLNSKELAEFIHSFYDKESGTFPKGPEGVCTMVGKKFGEQAEQVARKFVERMAPQQQDNSMNELARIKQLSGM